MTNLMKPLRVFPILLLSMISTNGIGLEYHGYFRSGIGASQWGTDQQRFEVPGAGAAFRLGNETDTYIETAFSQDHGKSSESDPFFRSHVRFTFKSAGHRDWEPTNAEFNAAGVNTANSASVVALREAYAEGKNVCGAGTNLWVGKRFYMREDLHMLDFYLIDNAGPGAGLEGIGLGALKLNFAVTRNVPAPEKDDLPSQTNVDLRLDAIEVAPGAKLAPVFIYGATGERGANGKSKWESLNGIHSALFYRQELGSELNNQLALQYGTGIFGGIGSWGASSLNHWGGWDSNRVAAGENEIRKAREKSSTIRISDQLTLGKSDSISGQLLVLYESIDFGGDVTSVNGVSTKVPDKTKLMAGIRPVYHFSPNSQVAFEIGHTAVGKQMTGDATASSQKFSDLTMTKYTIAPAITPELGFWSRPQLRFFATYAQWNDDVMDTGVYTGDNGFSIGSQVEAWW